MPYDVKRGRRIGAALLGCGAVMLIVWAWPREREPVYQGKTLSEWLRAYVVSGRPGMEQQRAAAKEAVCQMGTNALPWLVSWVGYEPPRWSVTPMLLAQKARFGWLFRKLLDQQIGPRFYGETGFEILGPAAWSAIPDLRRLALRRGKKQSSVPAVEALGYIGPESLPALIAVLEQGDPACHEMAGICVRRLNETGVDVRTAVPGLLLLDRELRQRATMLSPDPGHYVSQLEYESALLVSSLTNCLWHSNAIVRLEAAQYLGWLSEQATSAEPALSHAFEDPDVKVREAATNAVHRIVQGVLEQDREKMWAR